MCTNRYLSILSINFKYQLFINLNN